MINYIQLLQNVTANSNKSSWMCQLYKGKQFASNWKWFWARSAILDNTKCRRPADKKRKEGGTRTKLVLNWRHLQEKWGFLHQHHGCNKTVISASVQHNSHSQILWCRLWRKIKSRDLIFAEGVWWRSGPLLVQFSSGYVNSQKSSIGSA